MSSVDFTALNGYQMFSADPKLPPHLGPLGRINIFIGENNSGKSRFLRWLAKTKLKFTTSLDVMEKLNLIVQFTRSEVANALGNGHTDANGYWEKSQKVSRYDWVTEEHKYREGLSAFLLDISRAAGGAGDVRGNWNTQSAERLKGIADRFTKELAQINAPETFKFPKFYIPTLRTLRHVAEDDIYQTRINEDYFKDGQPAPTTFTGLSLYQRYKQMLLGTAEQRKWVSEFEQFLSDTFYPGQKVTLIPREGTKTLDVQIGDNKQRAIFELGDGVQSIILLTFPLFEQKNNEAIFFFDEPEAFLHPGFQRVFLTTLRDTKMFPRHQYFLTTHSNHLLDMTADKESISVFTFKPNVEPFPFKAEEAFIIENVSNDNIQPLALLGVRNSSVLLSNCTVWVEGITDRRYLARWLKLYVDEDKSRKLYREDLHFSFCGVFGREYYPLVFLG
jgi:AAA15 family ATPase/GTPase